MKNKIILREKGLNGFKTFSIFEVNEGKEVPVITNKKLLTISKELIRIYSNLAKEISKYYYYDFSGDFPKEVDIKSLSSRDQADLIEIIADKFPYK